MGNGRKINLGQKSGHKKVSGTSGPCPVGSATNTFDNKSFKRIANCCAAC